MFIEIFCDCRKYYSADRNLTIEHNTYGCSDIEPRSGKYYCVDGQLHNEIGPAICQSAIIRNNGEKKYFLLGEGYSYENWLFKTKKMKKRIKYDY